MLDTLYSWDLGIYRFINSRLTSQALDPIVSALSSNALWFGIMVLAIAVALVRRNRHMLKILGAIVVACSITDAVSTYLLKPGFHRVRPCHYLEAARRLGNICGSEFGMPSNHAANGMAIAVIIGAFASRTWFALALLFAFLVGLTRVYLGVHYPSDVLAGYLFGIAFGGTVARFFRPLINERKA